MLIALEVLRTSSSSIIPPPSPPPLEWSLKPLPTAMACFLRIAKKIPVEVKAIEDVELKNIFRYDMFGFERSAFLSRLLRVEGTLGYVAVNNDGLTRPTFLQEEGYLIGPLFADSKAIAEATEGIVRKAFS